MQLFSFNYLLKIKKIKLVDFKDLCQRSIRNFRPNYADGKPQKLTLDKDIFLKRHESETEY